MKDDEGCSDEKSPSCPGGFCAASVSLYSLEVNVAFS